MLLTGTYWLYLIAFKSTIQFIISTHLLFCSLGYRWMKYFRLAFSIGGNFKLSLWIVCCLVTSLIVMFCHYKVNSIIHQCSLQRWISSTVDHQILWVRLSIACPLSTLTKIFTKWCWTRRRLMVVWLEWILWLHLLDHGISAERCWTKQCVHAYSINMSYRIMCMCRL